jgi:hypothetical protein
MLHVQVGLVLEQLATIESKASLGIYTAPEKHSGCPVVADLGLVGEG